VPEPEGRRNYDFMKHRAIVYFSLLISLVSLCYAAWVHHQMTRLAHQQEAELVRNITPLLRDFGAGFGINPDKIPKNPQTLAELFQPISSEVHKIAKP
jgi:hypothetical protein